MPTYHLAKNGNDSNSGATSASAVATWDRALGIMSSGSNSTLAIHGGTYTYGTRYTLNDTVDNLIFKTTGSGADSSSWAQVILTNSGNMQANPYLIQQKGDNLKFHGTDRVKLKIVIAPMTGATSANSCYTRASGDGIEFRDCHFSAAIQHGIQPTGMLGYAWGNGTAKYYRCIFDGGNLSGSFVADHDVSNKVWEGYSTNISVTSSLFRNFGGNPIVNRDGLFANCTFVNNQTNNAGAVDMTRGYMVNCIIAQPRTSRHSTAGAAVGYPSSISQAPSGSNNLVYGHQYDRASLPSDTLMSTTHINYITEDVVNYHTAATNCWAFDLNRGITSQWNSTTFLSIKGGLNGMGMDDTKRLTVAAWVKYHQNESSSYGPAGSGRQNLDGIVDGGKDNFSLWFGSAVADPKTGGSHPGFIFQSGEKTHDATASFVFTSSAGNTEYPNYATTTANNPMFYRWHFVVGVMDAVSSSNNLAIYVDGLKGSGSAGRTYNSASGWFVDDDNGPGGSDPLLIGAKSYYDTGSTSYRPYSGYGMEGTIGPVAIWSASLSTEEVVSIYNNGIPTDLRSDFGNYASSNKLKGYWSMGTVSQPTYTAGQANEGNGAGHWSIPDDSTNNNPMTSSIRDTSKGVSGAQWGSGSSTTLHPRDAISPDHNAGKVWGPSPGAWDSIFVSHADHRLKDFATAVTGMNMAIYAGTVSGAHGSSSVLPYTDLLGYAFNNPPSIGAYEYQDLIAPQWTPASGTASVSNVGGTSASIGWGGGGGTPVAADNVAVTGYHLRLFHPSSEVHVTQESNVAAGVTSWNITGLTEYTAYTGSIEAFDAAGNTSSNGPRFHFHTKDRSAPYYNTGSNVYSGIKTSGSEANTDTSISLYWSGAVDSGVGLGGTAQQTLYYRLTGSSWTLTATLPANRTTTTVTGLTSWRTYDFKLYVQDASGNIKNRAISGTHRVDDTVAPTWSPVSGTASVANVGKMSASIRWGSAGVTNEPSASDSASGIRGYVVTIYNPESPGSTLIEQKTSSFATDATGGICRIAAMAGLSEYKAYTGSVQAYDFAGNTSSNGPKIYFHTKDRSAPYFISELNTSGSESDAETEVSLTWNVTDDKSGLATLQLYVTGELTATIPTDRTTTTVKQLKGYTSYNFKLVATDNSGNVRYSAFTHSTEDLSAPTWTPASGTASVSNVGAVSATIVWGTDTSPSASDPAGPNGGSSSGIKGYMVSLYHPRSGSNFNYPSASTYAITQSRLTTSANTLTWDALTEFTAYTGTIQAFDVAGNTSSNGPRFYFHTKDRTAPYYNTGSNVYSGIKTSGSETNQGTMVSLYWSGAIDTGVGMTGGSQTLYFKPTSSTSWTLTATLGPAVTTTTVTGLSEYVYYDFKIYALDASGNIKNHAISGAHKTADVTAPSWSPASGTASVWGVGATSASVKWGSAGVTNEPSASDAGSGIRGYVLTLYDPANPGSVLTEGKTGSFASDATGGVFHISSWGSGGGSSLTEYTAYTGTLEAYDFAGNTSSNGPKFYFHTKDRTAPVLADALITSGSESDTEAMVSLKWTAPTDAGAGIKNQKLFYRHASSGSGDDAFSASYMHTATFSGSSRITTTVTGLEPYESYVFKLQATDISGNVTSVFLTHSTEDTTAPSWSAGTTLSGRIMPNSGKIALNWSAAAVDNVDPFRYYVYVKSGSADWRRASSSLPGGAGNTYGVVSASGPNLNITATLGTFPAGLGTVWKYKVEAQDEAGNLSSDSSIEATFNVPSTAWNDTASVVRSGASVSQVTLSWPAATSSIYTKEIGGTAPQFKIYNGSSLVTTLTSGSNAEYISREYTVTSLTECSAYNFKVYFVDGLGNIGHAISGSLFTSGSFSYVTGADGNPVSGKDTTLDGIIPASNVITRYGDKKMTMQYKTLACIESVKTPSNAIPFRIGLPGTHALRNTGKPAAAKVGNLPPSGNVI